jgi:Undecaprenyl-phosphate galactose phosphotransferase WbaP
MGPELAKSRFAQYAIVAMPQKSNQELRFEIEQYCKGYTRVLLIPDMTGLCSLGIRTREVGGEIGFEFRQRLFSFGAAVAKRTIDVFLCCVALVLLSPVFLLIAALVKLTSRGSIFFGHLRYGLDGNTFRAWKFRTMVPDASAKLAEFLARHPERLSEWERDHKLKDDPRVTLLGKWLRRLSFDELPQLVNVLLGQMSLVGPRPIVKAEIHKYGVGFELYSRVRPGITGLWQVSGRNNTSYEERVLLDEYYVHNWSVWLDIYILIRTLKVVATADGAY